jgi:putative peptidoglycan lipid II flippase
VTDAFIQVVVQSAATATLPILSKHHAVGEREEYSRILRVNISVILVLSVIAAGACIFIPEYIVAILYGKGTGTDAIASLVALLAFNLPLYSLNAYFVSAFSAARDGKGLFFANLIATTLSIVALFLAKGMGYGIVSMAIATWTLGGSYTLLLLYFYSRKKHTTKAV